MPSLLVTEGGHSCGKKCRAITLGKSCRIHDYGGKQGECIAPNSVSKWCDRPWCFVDGDLCRASNSKVAYYKSNTFEGFYFSMMTCNPDIPYIPDHEVWTAENETFIHCFHLQESK